MKYALAFVILLFGMAAAYSQWGHFSTSGNCFLSHQIGPVLKRMAKEELRYTGMQSKGVWKLEIYVSDDGTYSLVAMLRDGRSCFFASGVDFEEVPKGVVN